MAQAVGGILAMQGLGRILVPVAALCLVATAVEARAGSHQRPGPGGAQAGGR